MKQFVPMTDDMLFQAKACGEVLVPYRCGMPCLHRLGVRESVDVSVAAAASDPAKRGTTDESSIRLPA